MLKVTIFTIFLLFVSVTQTVFAETYSQTFTKNDKTYIVTKTIENGVVTIETKIYDPQGNLLDSKKVVKDAKPQPEKETVDYPTKKITPIPTPIITQEVELTPTPIEEQIQPKPQTSSYLRTNFPLEVSSQTGNLVITTGSGDKELMTSPDSVARLAESKGISIISEISIMEENGEFKYLLNGVKKGKFLAIFEVYLPTIMVFNADTGLLEKTEQSSLVRIADFLSIK